MARAVPNHSVKTKEQEKEIKAKFIRLHFERQKHQSVDHKDTFGWCDGTSHLVLGFLAAKGTEKQGQVHKSHYKKARSMLRSSKKSTSPGTLPPSCKRQEVQWIAPSLWLLSVAAWNAWKPRAGRGFHTTHQGSALAPWGRGHSPKSEPSRNSLFLRTAPRSLVA